MKKVGIIVGGIALLALGAVTYFFVTNKENNLPAGTNQATLPTSQTGESTTGDSTMKMNLRTAQGTEIAVTNFLALPQTKKDLENSGYYTVGSQEGENALYLISYIDETNYFNIVLLKEPLGDNRVQAENYLRNTLGISKEDMCLLSYTLGVPNAVNSNYSGTNLGFSYCPNAVTLP